MLPANSRLVLAAVSDQTAAAGTTLSLTDSATDSDLPAPTLTYSLPTGPATATINPSNGALAW